MRETRGQWEENTSSTSLEYSMRDKRDSTLGSETTAGKSDLGLNVGKETEGDSILHS